MGNFPWKVALHEQMAISNTRGYKRGDRTNLMLGGSKSAITEESARLAFFAPGGWLMNISEYKPSPSSPDLNSQNNDLFKSLHSGVFGAPGVHIPMKSHRKNHHLPSGELT